MILRIQDLLMIIYPNNLIYLDQYFLLISKYELRYRKLDLNKKENIIIYNIIDELKTKKLKKYLFLDEKKSKKNYLI